jgi:signal transduction histidine kinase
MIQPFRTLRFKLPAAYMLLFAAVQVTLWIIIRLVIRGYLNDRFDSEMLNQAHAIVQAIELSEKKENRAPADPPDLAALSEVVKSTLEATAANNVFACVLFKGAEIPIETSNLRGVRLPRAEHPAEEPQFHIETHTGPVAAALLGPGQDLRLVTMYVDSTVTPPYELQVAASRDVVERAVVDLQELLTLFLLISLLVAGATSWLVAQRSLAPLVDLRDQAVMLSPEHLEQRLPLPAGDDEVTDLARALNGLLSRFEDQFKNQHRFISYVGHELKTPLAILLNEVQDRRRASGADPAARAFFDTIEDEARRLLRTVESFLILARARRRLEIVSDVQIEEVVLEAVRNCRRESRDCSVPLVPKIVTEDGAPEAIVSGDADLLLRATENLLRNALRYSPSGQSIDVVTRTNLKEVEIRIRDQGPGIPQEDIERIFDMYAQTSQPGVQPGKLGIGLALVKAVVELHGGNVRARNLDGAGCEFTIQLPLARTV